MSIKKMPPTLPIIKLTLLILGMLVFLVIAAVVFFYFLAGSSNLPPKKLSQIFNYHRQSTETPSPSTKAFSKSHYINNTDTFTVMTYNMGYLAGMTNNLPVETDIKMFEKNMATYVQLVKKLQPDFIGFQEIDFFSRRSFYQDQLQIIAKKTDFPFGALAVNFDKRYVPFPYWPPAVHFGKVISGQAVLSKYPIKSNKRIVLERPKENPFYYDRFYLDRLAQVVTIKLNHNTLVIINVHLEAYEDKTREIQTKKVLEIYRSYKNDYPVLIMGDFNSLPPQAEQQNNFIDEPGVDYSNDDTIQLLLEEKSLKVEDLEKTTFPSVAPTRKLDYIFYNHQKIECLKVEVPVLNSSDHLPVVMRFRIKDKSSSNGVGTIKKVGPEAEQEK